MIGLGGRGGFTDEKGGPGKGGVGPPDPPSGHAYMKWVPSSCQLFQRECRPPNGYRLTLVLLKIII